VRCEHSLMEHAPYVSIIIIIIIIMIIIIIIIIKDDDEFLKVN
jgi:hypothetical protein